jgi:hypothetical protein
MLAGCAAPQMRVLPEGVPEFRPISMELTETPFFPQEDYQCGPAALATTLNAAGIRASPDMLAQQVFIPARRGSLQVEMLAAARRNGAVGLTLPPKLEALLGEVAHGTPVIVLQNLGLNWAPMWHYAVVIGYDLDAGKIILRSGRTRRQELTLSVFERRWARSQHWSMVTVPPGTIPVTAAESDFLQAAIAFEKTASAKDASLTYASAAAKWPSNQLALLGLGNAAFSLQDWNTAESAYRRLSQAAPDPVPALNNLALTLDAQGRRSEAIEIARGAVALRGPFAAQSEKTLTDLLEKSGTEDNRN